MHADGGRMIERRSGTREATTFKKLPSASPGARKAAAIAASTDSVSATDAGPLAVARGRPGSLEFPTPKARLRRADANHPPEQQPSRGQNMARARSAPARCTSHEM